jgi:hypothetical protein
MTDSDVRVETWKGIPGFGFYEASDCGRIRSLPGGRRGAGRVLATRISQRGYVLVNLTDDGGTRQTRSVHSLVLLTFAGPPPRGQESRHWNDDPLDNRWPENLMYGTRAENDADRLRNNPEGIPRPLTPPANCSYCGERPAHARGWCGRCYQRWYGAGKPESGPPPAPQPQACPRCSRRWSRRVADAVSRWWSR